MRQFDLYEFAGYLAPGTLCLVGLSIAKWGIRQNPLLNNPSIGSAAVFLILAFVAGHVVQLVGKGLEWAWWWALYQKKWPQDWVWMKHRRFLLIL
jgi:hypothetical protein